MDVLGEYKTFRRARTSWMGSDPGHDADAVMNRETSTSTCG